MKCKVLFLLAALIAVAACTRDQDPGTGKNQVITLLDNGKVSEGRGSIDDYVGAGKHTLLFFWTSWCHFCKEDAPNIVSLYERYAPKLLVVGINDDKEESREAAVDAIRELGFHFPQILDASHELLQQYEVTGYPEYILVNPDGSILAKGGRAAVIETEIKKVL